MTEDTCIRVTELTTERLLWSQIEHFGSGRGHTLLGFRHRQPSKLRSIWVQRLHTFEPICMNYMRVAVLVLIIRHKAPPVNLQGRKIDLGTSNRTGHVPKPQRHKSIREPQAHLASSETRGPQVTKTPLLVIKTPLFSPPGSSTALDVTDEAAALARRIPLFRRHTTL